MRLAAGDRLVLATHNAGKLAEFAALFAPCGVHVVSAGDLGLPEPAETEATFVGNARIKGHAAARATGLPALADDSGLCVDALGGAPGVYSADWAEGSGGRDFHRAIRRVFGLLEGKPEPWSAQFRSTLVLASADGTDQVFEGVLHGRIVWPMRGAMGYGYDPIFLPDGMDRTVAELMQDEKNALSHRGRAVRALLSTCFT
jgi:XTP/dITP diphosphohydrolase